MIRNSETVAVRLYYNNPEHQKILEVIHNLDKSIYKTKNKFFVDAVLFYLDNYGKEEFMNVNRLSDSKYITKQEINNLINELKNEVKTIAHDQALAIIGQMMAGIPASDSKNNILSDGIEIKENETEDTTFEEDDDIADYALSFMDFD